MMKIQTKRIYDMPDARDGSRILVDKLWPRGISKEKAQLAFWAKQIAPSTGLRQKFHQGLCNKAEFRHDYFIELENNKESFNELMAYIRTNDVVTFLFSSKLTEFNNATVLKEYVEKFSQPLN